MSFRTAIYRKEHFNAAHRLHVKGWSEEKNDAVFGKCNNPSFHGHNYEVEVRLIGVPDATTGYLYDLKELSTLIWDKALKKFDHKNLNLDTEEFRDLNPTAENIARVIFELLRPSISEDLDLQIRLYETPRNFVEYPA